MPALQIVVLHCSLANLAYLTSQSLHTDTCIDSKEKTSVNKYSRFSLDSNLYGFIPISMVAGNFCSIQTSIITYNIVFSERTFWLGPEELWLVRNIILLLDSVSLGNLMLLDLYDFQFVVTSEYVLFLISDCLCMTVVLFYILVSCVHSIC